METSNPCGLLFSTGGESPNLPGLDLSWLWGRDFEEDYLFLSLAIILINED